MFENILEALGEDREREALKETQRVAQSYGELFSGLLQNSPKDILQRTFTVHKMVQIVEKNIHFSLYV